MKERQGSKPTVRGSLYYLESRRIVPKNDHVYERLVRALSNARRGYERADGTRGPPTIDMDAFADNTRQIIKDFNDKERSLQNYIDDGISHFKKLPIRVPYLGQILIFTLGGFREPKEVEFWSQIPQQFVDFIRNTDSRANHVKVIVPITS